MSDEFDALFGDFDPTADLDELDWNNPDGPLPLKPIATKDKEGKAEKKKDELEGVDEELKVSKRKPRAKLDADRLLGPNGLPKIRREAPKRLKFKGKGHEYKDCAKLLAFYQIWADELFPKAKFRDSLAMIEKLGHSRRVQGARAVYIEEDKKEKMKAEEEQREKETERIGDVEPSKPTVTPSTASNDVPDDMDLDYIFGPPPPAARSSPPAEGDLFDDFDDFDAEFAAAFAQRDEEKAKEREAQRQKNLADMEARRKEKEEKQPPTSASGNGSKSTLDPDFDEDELFAEPAPRSTASVTSGVLPPSLSEKDTQPSNKAAQQDEIPDLDEMDYEPNQDELEALYAMP